MLLSGTLRFNLDPLNQYSDAKIWSALEAVEMKDRVRETCKEGLLVQLKITESSDAKAIFTQDEQHLICLARVVLKSNRILVLEELSVKKKTMDTINRVLENEFLDSTVLRVVHHLDSLVTLNSVSHVLFILNGEKRCMGTISEMLFGTNSTFRALTALISEKDRDILVQAANKQL